MPETGTQGLGDLFALFGGNPLATVAKNVENFRAAVDGSLAALANLNKTLESLDAMARRVNSLMDDIEGPMRAVMPQLTRVTEQSAKLFEQLTGPMDRLVPGLDQLASTLSSPMFNGMPNVLGDFLDTLRDLGARLRPLGQMAEAAGAMFGMRGMTGLRIPGSTAPATPVTATTPDTTPSSPPPKVPSHKVPSSATTAQAKKKSPAKKKAGTKKAGTKKAGAKKAATKDAGGSVSPS